MGAVEERDGRRSIGELRRDEIAVRFDVAVAWRDDQVGELEDPPGLVPGRELAV